MLFSALAKIEQLLKKKSLVGILDTFRVVTGTFGTPEAAKKAAKKLRFKSFKGENENRIYTVVFMILESVEEAWALIEVEYGYNPRIKSYSA